jgi:hypothetical protein
MFTGHEVGLDLHVSHIVILGFSLEGESAVVV